MEQLVARIEPVYDTYFGTTVADPYRWMEDGESEDLQIWLKEQGAYTRTVLDALPEHAVLVERILTLRQVGIRIFDIKVAGGRVFYLRADPDLVHTRLMMRSLPAGPEEAIYDPNKCSPEMATPIAWYVPSPNGQQLLFDLKIKKHKLYVLEVDSGTVEDLDITGAGYDDGGGRGSPAWLPDSSGIIYPHHGSMWLHHLGSTSEHDIAVWGCGVNNLGIVDEGNYFVALSATSAWMLGLLFYGDRHECSVYTAPVASLNSAPAAIPWIKVAGIEHGIIGYALHGDTVYLRTHKDAPRYQIIATPLHQPDLANARVVVPPGSTVIQGMLVVGDYLLVQELDGGIGRLRRVAHAGGTMDVLPLPFNGSVELFNNWNSMPLANDTGGSDVFFRLQSWTVAPKVYRCNIDLGSVIDTGWLPSSPIENSTYETHQMFASGRDGMQIPISIIHRKGLAHDGKNPTILYAYGSYGLAMTPFFWAEMLAWYERGGILAIAGVRGGGEYGREWHEAGMLLNKANTIEDFIVCAEHLIAEGYTTPARLAGMGISAGSYPTGGALVRQPDLWGAMVIHVGEANTLRREQYGQGAVPEIGSVTTEEGFAALQITDSYSRVQDGMDYPAVLLTTGARDAVVPSWQTAKMAARLQAATTSGKPILLRFDEDMGHVPKTEMQWAELHADMFAFLHEQLMR